jgi:putative membrane protein
MTGLGTNLGAHLGDRLAALNATLNATAAVLMLAGWAMMRFRKQAETHKRLMLGALAVSSVFLVSYLTRIAISGTHRYPGHGAMKVLYLGVLASHVLLAMTTVPLVLGAVWLALRRRFATHRKVVRWAFPIWLYVSVTGVVVYFMLYGALARAGG